MISVQMAPPPQNGSFHLLLRHLSGWLSPQQKRKLKGRHSRLRQKLVDAFWSFGPAELTRTLHSMGIQPGDTLMVHSSFSRSSGFKGGPGDLINALLSAIGPDGNLLMLSSPYCSSTYEYVQRGLAFDVRKTVSRMGIVSEIFRRRSNVRRSLHPTHPVLAYGPKAEWLIADHEKCLGPCGEGTPFAKVAQLHGKVLFFNVPFVFTFLHYLEESHQQRTGITLFSPQIFELPVIDSEGNRRTVATYVYSLEAVTRRRPELVSNELQRRGLVREKRLGKSRLQVIHTQDTIQCVGEMLDNGVPFYA